jgi:branched-chain amino acid transport system ATP-binding protein
MLSVRGLQGGYGETQVLFDVSLDIAPGEVVALLGRNGMGKTTSVRAIMGLLPARAGSIAIDGHDVAGRRPFEIARLGLGLVPEGRQVFPTLTVEENLVATSRPGAWTLASVFDLFPRLAERRRHSGRQLSGGEQQMLAIGRALMTNPRLLILDEATEGLAPLIRAEIWACLARLKAAGLAILLIDKSLDALMRLAVRHVIIEKGVTVWTGTSAELAAAPEPRERYLHV